MVSVWVSSIGIIIELGCLATVAGYKETFSSLANIQKLLVLEVDYLLPFIENHWQQLMEEDIVISRLENNYCYLETNICSQGMYLSGN